MNEKEKYARLIVRFGANVQKGEDVFVSAPVDAAAFTRSVVEECYRVGARKVTVNWEDEKTSRCKFLHETKEAITDIYNYSVARTEEIVDRKGVLIHIISEDPNIFQGVDPAVMSAYTVASAQKNKKYYDSAMSGKTRWTLAAYPNPEWAKAVYPDLTKAKAVKKLWELIAKAVRLDALDPISAWEDLSKKLAARVEVLNNAKIKSFRYVNSLGTDFYVEPCDNYVFEGGSGISPESGVRYNANIPTEEVFSAPKKNSAKGKIVSSMPLIYNCNKIDGFFFEFNEGRIINYGAKEGYETLKELIETDEGTHCLGEIALVGYNSPIQNLKTLFYNTLFDENASCHFAIGRAYPSCVKGGGAMDGEQQLAAGLNYSYEHVDFMIGTPDLEIRAKLQDGSEMLIFNNGDWAF